MALRALDPTTGTSLLETLNHLIELEEEKAARGPLCDQMILPPQVYRNRYTLALVCESLHNILAAVTGIAMTQHDYRQREARVIFELLIQDKSSVKPDSKFYEKRTEIKGNLKDRFRETNWFQLTPSGTEIQTESISESEAEETYAFCELCASLLGDVIFSAPFNPDKPILPLASNARNFDEENALQRRRILAVISPYSFKNLVESLEYTTMKKKAQGPVLNTVIISGNSNNGNHGTPLREDSEADKQDDINAIVNDYADSVQFRRLLKLPELEVVVDGTVISAPFDATADRRFQLPALAKFVQVFATQNGLRNIVSSLSLLRTGISGGNTWYSELELEGKQVVKLTVEPTMGDDGKLASSSLLVGYQPRLTVGAMVAAWRRDSWVRVKESWPGWITKPVFASIITVLALAPLFTINISSPSAFLILMLSLTALLMLAGKINPKGRLIWRHHVAISSFVAVMLITMLFFGILPIGRLAEPTIGAVAASRGETVSSAALMTVAARPFAPRLEGVTFDQTGATNYVWSVNGSQVLGSQFNLSIPGYNYDPVQDYLVVRPILSSADSWQGWLHHADKGGSFVSTAFNLQPRTLNPIWLESFQNQIPERARIEAPSAAAAASADKNVVARVHAHGVRRGATAIATLRDVFEVEVLVDTNEIITLIGDGSTLATELVTPAVSNQSATMGTQVLATNAAVANSVNQPTSESQPNGNEVTKTGGTAASLPAVASVRKTAAWVVFDSPTQLGSLNKGDVVNANFKPMLVSTTDPRGVLLGCTATGVVRDKRTSGTDVELRVGLKLTWMHNGKPVNGSLDLLMTDCASDKENSHQGFLAAPQDQVAEVARLEPRLLKP
jgi:hypothetical protein